MRRDFFEQSVRHLIYLLKNLPSTRLKQTYFPNLDALRGIAAIFVVLGHIEFLKPGFRLKRIPLYSIFDIGANIAVTLFFVLSGFLITYLLVNEKEEKQKIFLKEFYIRRTLRIWPLFYLTLFISYIIVPQFFPSYSRYAYTSSFVLNALFLTNITYALHKPPPLGTPVWSIGIEEQFYIFWPWVLIKTRLESLMKRLLLIILSIFIFKAALLYFSNPGNFIHKIWILVNITRYDCLFIGAIAALLYKGHSIKIGRLQINYYSFANYTAQVITYTLLILTILANLFYKLPIIHQWYSFLFMSMILSMATYEKSIVRIDNRILNYLGKISYSIYLLHMFVIAVLYKFVISNLPDIDIISQNFIIYSMVILSTIIVASASYYFIEKPFLKLKEKFR